jgi:hypothetical protein
MTDIQDLVCAITGKAPVVCLDEPHGCALRPAERVEEARPEKIKLADRTNDDGVEPNQIGGFNG